MKQKHTTIFKIAIASCAAVSTMAIATTAQARPVSYPGGWTVMQNNQDGMHRLHVHYSPHYTYSLGGVVQDMGDQDHMFYGVQYNRLEKRWNKKGSQANLYTKWSVGVAEGDFNQVPNSGYDEERLAANFTVAFDAETRRHFFSADANLHAVEGQMQDSYKSRIGIAPYIGKSGAIHTWLMIEGKYEPNIADNDFIGNADAEEFTVTPLVRFFKGSALLELGYSSNDEPLVNMYYRF